MKLRLHYALVWDALGICLWPVWYVSRRIPGTNVILETAEYTSAREACDAVRAGRLS